MTWLASMPETKMLIWVALAAMAPGMARPISALISGVSFGMREPDARARPVARPTTAGPAWHDAGDGHRPIEAAMAAADGVGLRQDRDQRHEVEQGRRDGRDGEAAARVQHPRQQGARWPCRAGRAW